MNNQKILVLLIVIISTLPTLGMQDSFNHKNNGLAVVPNTSNGIGYPAEVTNIAFDHLVEIKFYHQISTEKYRNSVEALRHEIKTLKANIESSVSNDQLLIVKQEISQLEETLELQKEVLCKYGLDRTLAKQKILEEITEFKEINNSYQERITNEHHLKHLYKLQMDETTQLLETCKKYIGCIERSETSLKSTLNITQKYLKTLEQKTVVVDQLKQNYTNKINDLKKLYEIHVKGLSNSSAFFNTVSMEVLESLSVTETQLTNVHTENLFYLFARSLELPYILVHTGEKEEEIYLNHLKIIHQNFINRLQEDVAGFQISESIFKHGEIKINFADFNIEVGKFMINPQTFKANIHKQQDIDNLKKVLLTYGYKDEIQSGLLETALDQSTYGLLGLYLNSLEFFPITSWNDSQKIAHNGRMNNIKSKKDFLSSIIENFYLILGRHFNKTFLEKINEKLHLPQSSKESTSSTSFDIYF